MKCFPLALVLLFAMPVHADWVTDATTSRQYTAPLGTAAGDPVDTSTDSMGTVRYYCMAEVPGKPGLSAPFRCKEVVEAPPPPPPPPPVPGIPTIGSASGPIVHKGPVTISGTGFGVKAQAAPVVWDDASGSDIRQKWSGVWPNQNPTYNVAYRTPQRGIALPHNRITRYIAGAHYGYEGFDAGYNVMFWKNRAFASYPAYTYASWYQRNDDAWVFQDNSNVERDNNIKTFGFSKCCSPYEMPNNWYIEYNPRPTSRTSGANWHLNDDGASLQYPDVNGHRHWWSSAVNPMAGAWTKIELEIKYTNQSNGYIKKWENGVLKVNYLGATDRYPGMDRSEGIGGYARSRSTNNWRYFADVYLDYTRARVVLANSATLASATIIEAQIPATWTDGAITFAANLGKLSGSAWLYVINADGRASPGFPVILK
jgi:hypothetical protein